jgi:hypothetical protein
MKNGITEQVFSAQESVRELAKEFPPPSNLLPISQVFSEIHYRDDRTGRTEVCFTLSGNDTGKMPGFVSLAIRIPEQEVFHTTVKLKRLGLGKYVRESSLQRQALVSLSGEEFDKIDNNPEAEIIFHHKGQEFSSPLYI